MPHLTDAKPPAILQSTSWPLLQDLQLADPRYDKADKIDLILGADKFYDLYLADIQKGPRESPSAQHTILGYILIGKVEPSSTAAPQQRQVTCCFNGISVCEQVRKFWELEEVPDIKRFTKKRRMLRITLSVLSCAQVKWAVQSIQSTGIPQRSVIQNIKPFYACVKWKKPAGQR